jgi:putative ABC transport system substrate-binding protein
MFTRRRLLAGIGFGVLAPTFPLLAQPKVARIGILTGREPSTPGIGFEGFLRGMRDLGYVEGRNLVIDWRGAEGKYERFPALALELVALKPDVLISHSTPGTQALQRATQVIPIVMTTVSDPVGSGFAKSLARPGGNITGMSLSAPEISAKQVQLLKTLLPGMSRLAAVTNPGTGFHPVVLKEIERASKTLNVQVIPVQANSPETIERAFATMVRERVNAAIFSNDASFAGSQSRRTADLALKFRLPVMGTFRSDVEAGGLIAFGADAADSSRRAAAYVDKILKGAKPANLPIEQPSSFLLYVNLKTAKAMGVRVPQEILGRADEVIE